MTQLGHSPESFVVDLGDPAGELASSDELRAELTETRWLKARKIQIMLWNSDARISVLLDPTSPVLFVSYSGGDMRERELLRAAVERLLPPERPSRRKRIRVASVTVGVMATLTWQLAIALVPWRIHTSWTISRPLAIAILTATVLIQVASYSALSWVAISSWFPDLERLPDDRISRWNSKVGWVQCGVGVWAGLLIVLIAANL